MTQKHTFLGAYALTIAIIIYFDWTKCKGLPWPPRIIGTGLVFGMLRLLAIASEELATILAIGMVLAQLLNKGFVGNCHYNCPSSDQPGGIGGGFDIGSEPFTPAGPGPGTTTPGGGPLV
jgi:hypothetical protein